MSFLYYIIKNHYNTVSFPILVVLSIKLDINSITQILAKDAILKLSNCVHILRMITIVT